MTTFHFNEADPETGYAMKNSKKTQKKPRIRLQPHEYVVTAYAQPAYGPGWANAPLWVVIADGATGKMREHCIQPEQQTEEMRTLYAFSSLAHGKMTDAVQRVIKRNRP